MTAPENFPPVSWVQLPYGDDEFLPLVEVTEESLHFLQQSKQAAVSMLNVASGSYNDAVLKDMPPEIMACDERLSGAYFGEIEWRHGSTSLVVRGAAIDGDNLTSSKKAIVVKGMAYSMMGGRSSWEQI